MENFVPKLSAGSHKKPEDGACVMEMVSFLAGEDWSDMPSCTNQVLSRVAQRVNDSLENRNRHLILKDFDRLFNTRLSLVQEWAYSDEIEYLHLLREISHLEEEKSWLGVRNLHNVEDEIDRDIAQILTQALDIYDSMYGKKPAEKQDLSKLKTLLGPK